MPQSCVTVLNESLKKKKGNAIALERTYGSHKRCYFCPMPSTKKKFNRKKSLIEYPNNISSTICPFHLCDELPIPEVCEIDLLSLDNAESSEESSISELCISIDVEFDMTTSEPHLINESELNDLVRNLLQ